MHRSVQLQGATATRTALQKKITFSLLNGGKRSASKKLLSNRVNTRVITQSGKPSLIPNQSKIVQKVNGFSSGLCFVLFLLMKEEHQVFIARTMYLLKSFSCQINIRYHWTRKLAPLTVVSLFPISLVFMEHCSNTYLDLPKQTLQFLHLLCTSKQGRNKSNEYAINI